MTQPEIPSESGEEGSQVPRPQRPVARENFWSGTFILSNVVLLFLALIAGYLEYVAYPALMTASFPNGFGETNVVLNLSFLSFSLSAVNTNCSSSICPVKGIPAFDFCQALIYLIILYNLFRVIQLRSK